MIERDLSSAIRRSKDSLQMSQRMEDGSNTVSISGSEAKISSSTRDRLSTLRCICPRFPWLLRETALVFGAGRDGCLEARVWLADGPDEGSGTEGLGNDDCLLETVDTVWGPLGPEGKQEEFGRKAISAGTKPE
jgi:hypothetical protein